jgi:hypothetical protein
MALTHHCAPLTFPVVVALLAVGHPLAAQAPAPSGFDSFIMLVAPRDTNTIKKLVRDSEREIAAAQKTRQQAETMRLGATSRIEFKKVAIVRLKERIALAKKEGREADRVGLEAERKAAEKEIDLLRRREELREAEAVLETNRSELASLTKQALELELQLARRRATRRRGSLGASAAASLERVIGELEKQTLEAQRAQSAAIMDVADQEIRVIDRRLDLLDAQQRRLGGE